MSMPFSLWFENIGTLMATDRLCGIIFVNFSPSIRFVACSTKDIPRHLLINGIVLDALGLISNIYNLSSCIAH